MTLFAGNTGVAGVIYQQCSLVEKYFRGTLNAPDSYRRLWQEVQQLDDILRILGDVNNGELETFVSTPSRPGPDKALGAARESIRNLNDFLDLHNGIKDADKEWWSKFSQKRRFLEEKKNIEDLKNEFASHVRILKLLRSTMQ